MKIVLPLMHFHDEKTTNELSEEMTQRFVSIRKIPSSTELILTLEFSPTLVYGLINYVDLGLKSLYDGYWKVKRDGFIDNYDDEFKFYNGATLIDNIEIDSIIQCYFNYKFVSNEKIKRSDDKND